MQRVSLQYGLPKCILLTYCVDCYSIEQALISFNHGKEKCLNLSSNSTGGDGRNSTPPILTRDDTARCKIKTKDFPNVIKLLKMLPIKVVAKYYKVDTSTLYNLCKKHNIYYKKKDGKASGHHKRLKPLENRLAEFILDNYKLGMRELALKYKVDLGTITFWRRIYQVYKK